jgi:Flp pilus assembly protein TadB
MLVMVAICVLLTGLGAVAWTLGERRRDARHRILQLAHAIDAVARSIEADFASRPAECALERLAAQAQGVAQAARAALERKRMLGVLPSRRLYADEERLHHDHGAIVHLRSQVDACLAAGAAWRAA